VVLFRFSSPPTVPLLVRGGRPVGAGYGRVWSRSRAALSSTLPFIPTPAPIERGISSSGARGSSPFTALAPAAFSQRLTGRKARRGFINSMLRSPKVNFSKRKVRGKDREYYSRSCSLARAALWRRNFASSSKALERWDTVLFSSSVISANVFEQPKGTNIGSKPKPPCPLGS